SRPPPSPHPISLLESPSNEPAPAILRVYGCRDLPVGGVLAYPRPKVARHPSPTAVLAGLHVVEVRHVLVEERVADGASGVPGGQNDDTIAFDHSRLVPGWRGPSGQIGGKPLGNVLDADLEGEIGTAHGADPCIRSRTRAILPTTDICQGCVYERERALFQEI